MGIPHEHRRRRHKREGRDSERRRHRRRCHGRVSWRMAFSRLGGALAVRGRRLRRGVRAFPGDMEGFLDDDEDDEGDDG